METIKDQLVNLLDNGAAFKGILVLVSVLIVALTTGWILSRRKSSFVLTVEKLDLRIGEKSSTQDTAPKQDK
jgi:hypothetical protein